MERLVNHYQSVEQSVEPSLPIIALPVRKPEFLVLEHDEYDSSGKLVTVRVLISDDGLAYYISKILPPFSLYNWEAVIKAER